MTDRQYGDIVTDMSINPRTKIQVDCTPKVRYMIRGQALQRGWSLREAVLHALAKEFPEIKEEILSELEGQDA